jgi:hypothetical protein
MKNKSQNNKSFLEWAKKVSVQHPEILEHMRTSTDPLERVIAKRIMQTAGGLLRMTTNYDPKPSGLAQAKMITVLTEEGRAV